MGLRNLLVIIIVSLLTLVAAIAGGPTVAATPGTDFPLNIACEALLQQRSAYDESPNGCGGYDEASMLSEGEKRTRPAGVGAACEDLVEFDAAEGTGTGVASSLQGALLQQPLGAEEAAGASLPQSLPVALGSPLFSRPLAMSSLAKKALAGSREIIAAEDLRNPAIPEGFAKYTTDLFDTPVGPGQVQW